MLETKLDRNADINTQIREELGESTIPGLSTSLAQKFGQIPTRIDKNFWRQIKRPIWAIEKDEKGRDLWQLKKVEILAEVNKLIRRQIKEQSRLQGRQNTPGPGHSQQGQQIRPWSEIHHKKYNGPKPSQPSQINYNPLRDKYRKPNSVS
jgi:hypothetical protein